MNRAKKFFLCSFEFLWQIISISVLLTLTGCQPSYEIIQLNRPEEGYIDFNAFESFTFFDGHITLNGDLSPFPRGPATISITGKPDTEYHLSVILASGESQAAGLGATTSDSEGQASWSWRISSQVRPGQYSAVIIGGGDRLELDIEIE